MKHHALTVALLLGTLTLAACSRDRSPSRAATAAAATSGVAAGGSGGAASTGSASSVASGVSSALPQLRLAAVTPGRVELGVEAPLTLEGSGFVAGRVRVLVGPLAASDVSVVDSGRLVCKSPPLASGPHDVLVLRDDGSQILLAQAVLAGRSGLPDDGFGPAGLRTAPAAAGQLARHSIAVDPLGRSYELVGTASEHRLVRRTPAGEVDPAFSLVVPGEAGWALAVDAQGRPVVASTPPIVVGQPSTLLLLRRYLSDGQRDATFAGGTATLSLLDPSGRMRTPRQLLLDPQGRVLVTWHVAATAQPLAARWTALGAPEAGFGAGGEYRPALPPALRASVSDSFHAAAVDAQGRLLLAVFGNDPQAKVVLTRSTPDGQPDLGFGVAGQVVLLTIPIELTLAAGPLGRVVLGEASFVGATGFQAISLRAYTEAGVPDASFGTGGVVGLGTVPLNQGWLSGLAVDPRTGEVLAAGGRSGAPRLWLFDSAGGAHPAAPGGEVALPGGVALAAEGLVLDPWGRALAAGQLRLVANGPSSGLALWRVR